MGYVDSFRRAGSVARAMLQGGASREAAIVAADRTQKHHARIACGTATARAATAASMTRAIRNAPDAVRWADRPDVTGGIRRLTASAHDDGRDGARARQSIDTAMRSAQSLHDVRQKFDDATSKRRQRDVARAARHRGIIP